MNKNNDVTIKKMVSHVGEQNKAATISKNVSTMKIVHTNDFFEKIMEVFNKCGLDEYTRTPECEKCGEKFMNQTPFFQHVIKTHNAQQYIQQTFMIAAKKATNSNPDHLDEGGLAYRG